MRRANLIIFLTDDRGYGDLSCMGAPGLRTPHFDRLAAHKEFSPRQEDTMTHDHAETRG
jgi:hypothetical protein